jgi:hypothetical protein
LFAERYEPPPGIIAERLEGPGFYGIEEMAVGIVKNLLPEGVMLSSLLVPCTVV